VGFAIDDAGWGTSRRFFSVDRLTAAFFPFDLAEAL